MVAFKTESWIWYSVVWVIAISRLSVSQTQAYAHTHEAQSSPAQPNAQRPFQARRNSNRSRCTRTDKIPIVAFRAAWPLALFDDIKLTNT
jgi:hypothetical protein